MSIFIISQHQLSQWPSSLLFLFLLLTLSPTCKAVAGWHQMTQLNANQKMTKYKDRQSNAFIVGMCGNPKKTLTFIQARKRVILRLGKPLLMTFLARYNVRTTTTFCTTTGHTVLLQYWSQKGG
jgi:hypothetical protein